MKTAPAFRLLLSILSLWSAAANAADFQSPRTAALGGAGHASPMLNDALYLNPSFVSFLPTYSISANYGFYGGPTSCDNCGRGDPHGKGLNLSLQDGRSELFQAGVGLSILEDRKIINLGASRSIVQRFGVGIGGKWVLPNLDSPSPIWDVVLSTSAIPLDMLQLAFIVDNLFQFDSGIPYGMYREFILGSKINVMNIVLIYFDPHLAPSAPETFGHEAGLEFPLMQDFFLRLGNFRKANVPSVHIRGSGYSLGLGWVAPRISFDAGMQRMLSPVLANFYTFGVTVFF